MRRFVLGLIGVLVAPALAAQDVCPDESRRPRIDGDTNSARAYYAHGVEKLETEPKVAATAFCWASRIDPNWAAPLYARRIALYLADPLLLVSYMEFEPAVLASARVQQIDSLDLRASMIDPLHARDLERPLVTRYLREAIAESMRRAGAPPLDAVSAGEIDFAIRRYLTGTASYYTRAINAASEGAHRSALGLYRLALAERPGDVGIRVERARLYYALGVPDSAVLEMQAAVAELRRRDDARTRPVYRSKATHEFAIGQMFERAGKADSAAPAYERALTENLAYYPAHARLGVFALRARDTATAIRELEQAVEAAPDVANVRITLALVLAQAGRVDDAVALAQRATEVAPYYAWPRYVLGRVRELKGDTVVAAAAYRSYLAAASQDDARRADATQRLARLAPED